MKLFNALLMLTCTSCMVAKPRPTIPLIGNYPTTPIVIESSKSFDQVWDNLIDIFAQQGLPIKLIDKNSGFISCEHMPLNVTYEDKNGKLVEPNSMIVVGTILSSNGRRVPVTGTISGAYAKVMVSNQTFGDWNVRVKKTDTGASINVNITNVTYKMYTYPSGYANYSLDNDIYKSTGLFETRLSNLLNK